MGRLDRAWRLVGTGLAFATLGLGGMVLAATVIPLISLITANREARIQRTQYVVHWGFRLYILLLRRTRIIDLDISAVGGLADCRGHVIIANHPTLLDVVLLMSFNPHIRCIVKHQLWNDRFLGGVVRSAGYIPNDLPSEEMIEACAEALNSGGNLLIFPEGTRSRPGTTQRFQRGFATIAMLADAPVRMARITCLPATLTKGEAWWRIPTQRPIFRVADLGALAVADYRGYPYRALGARRMVAAVEQRYVDRLTGQGGPDSLAQTAVV